MATRRSSRATKTVNYKEPPLSTPKATQKDVLRNAYALQPAHGGETPTLLREEQARARARPKPKRTKKAAAAKGEKKGGARKGSATKRRAVEGTPTPPAKRGRRGSSSKKAGAGSGNSKRPRKSAAPSPAPESPEFGGMDDMMGGIEFEEPSPVPVKQSRRGSARGAGASRPRAPRLSASSPLTGAKVLDALDAVIQGGGSRSRTPVRSRRDPVPSPAPRGGRRGGRGVDGVSTSDYETLRSKYERVKMLLKKSEKDVADSHKSWKKKESRFMAEIGSLQKQFEATGGASGAAERDRKIEMLEQAAAAKQAEADEARRAAEVAGRERDALLEANEALNDELERTHDTYQTITSVRAVPDDKNPDLLHCSSVNRMNEKAVRYDIEFTAGDEDELQLVWHPKSNDRHLPKYLRKKVAFAPDKAPQVIAKTIDGLFGTAQ